MSSYSELTNEEVDGVNGGGLAFGAVAGAVIGGANEYFSGGDLGDVAAGAFMGGVSGFFGGAGGMLWSAGSRLGGASVGIGGGGYFGTLPAIIENQNR